MSGGANHKTDAQLSAESATRGIEARDAPPLELRVAAFTALREEISRRSSAQLTLITLSLGAFTALATIATAIQPKRDAVLLFVPFVSGAAGMLWLDHHRRIGLIGRYILGEIFGGWPGSFEEKARKTAENEHLTALLGFVLPTVIVFAGPSIAALLWTYRELPQPGQNPIWWAGIVITSTYASGLLVTVGRSHITGVWRWLVQQLWRPRT